MLILSDSVKGGNSTNPPFLHLLPITDRAAAHLDFVKVRMPGGVDVSGDAAHALLPPDQAKTSPETDEEKKQHLQAEILSRWPYIFVGCLALVSIVVGLCIWRCCKRRKANRAKQLNKQLGLEANGDKSTSYLPLDEPHSAMPVMLQTFRQDAGHHQTNGGYRPSHEGYRPSHEGYRPSESHEGYRPSQQR